MNQAIAERARTITPFLAFDILEKVRVGVAPGIDFGKNGEGCLRFSYANSMENIIKGLDRVEQYIASVG